MLGRGLSRISAVVKLLELLGSNYREVIFGSYRIIYKIYIEIKILTLRNSRQLLGLDNLEL